MLGQWVFMSENFSSALRPNKPFVFFIQLLPNHPHLINFTLFLHNTTIHNSYILQYVYVVVCIHHSLHFFLIFIISETFYILLSVVITMFMITYNCRGYNSIKACFITRLLSQCDVLFIQEHWLLRDKLHLLQNISEEFIVFSKSSIDDGKLLIGRSYGGTAIFIRKSIKCTITNCDIECDRFNAMLVDFYNFAVLITCFYMPCVGCRHSRRF